MKETRVFRARRGFTLAETLIAILILLMAAAILAAGVPAAQRAYAKAVDGANAQVLLSTAATELRDELTMAKDVESSGTTIEYYSYDSSGGSYHTVKKTLRCDSGEGIYVDSSLETGLGVVISTDNKNFVSRLLVSDAAASKTMIVKFSGSSVSSTKDSITINNLAVYKKGSSDPVVKLDELCIPLIQAEE